MIKPKIIVIVGPTGIGKTKLSIEIAKKLNTEIISADSMQIYKYMNIGTAKVTKEEASGINHHMIDIVEPDEVFSVAEFQKKSQIIINNLNNINKIPVIIGGSGLYINSLIYDLDFSKTIGDNNIRDYYNSMYHEKGIDELFNLLKKVDPVSSNKIHKNNVKRVIRALEVYDITGKPFSKLNTNFRKETNDYDCIIVGLKMDRKLLYDRINLRVDKMIANGLIDEVSKLLSMGYTKDLVSLQGLGYKEIIAYLDNQLSKDEAINILKRNTRRFAKRQFTWFLRNDKIKWFDITNIDSYNTIVDASMKYILNEVKEDNDIC